MKRIISIVVSLVCVFCFCGCDALFGRASDKVKPHLIQYSEREANPVRPINSKAEADFSDYDGEQKFLHQLEDLYDIVVVQNLKPSFTYSKLDDRIKQIYSESIKILDRYIRNDFTQYERIHAIHDYLTSQVEYDEELYYSYLAGEDISPEDDSFLLSGPILHKSAVCDGFSKAFAFLCGIEGIETESMHGTFHNGINGIPHVWNKVKLDGKWYNIDTTMDSITFYPDRGDPITVVHHGYFLLSDKAMTGFGGHRFSGSRGYDADEDYPYFETAEAFVGADTTFSAQVNTKEELEAVFEFIKKSKRKYGQVELRLNLGLTDEQAMLSDAYSSEIESAYKKVSGKDFTYIPDKDIVPFQKYPRSVFVFLIYK